MAVTKDIASGLDRSAALVAQLAGVASETSKQLTILTKQITEVAQAVAVMAEKISNLTDRVDKIESSADNDRRVVDSNVFTREQATRMAIITGAITLLCYLILHALHIS